MKLHHRVTVKAAKRFGRWLYFWACPGCSVGSMGDRRHADVQRVAINHAVGCSRLYALNRETAHPCHNCNRTGWTGNARPCPACLGRGYL